MLLHKIKADIKIIPIYNNYVQLFLSHIYSLYQYLRILDEKRKLVTNISLII